MDTFKQGLPARVSTYAIGGGREANHFGLGYMQAGRFGESNAERDPSWSENQRKAYNLGYEARRLDDATPADMKPAQ